MTQLLDAPDNALELELKSLKVPAHVHRRLKVFAAKNDLSIVEAVEAAIEHYLLVQDAKAS